MKERGARTSLVDDSPTAPSGNDEKGFGRSSSPWVDEESEEAQAQGLLFGCFGHEDEEAGTRDGARARERPGEDAA